MVKRMVATVIVFVLSSLICRGSLQSEDEPRRLLEKVSETYKNMKSYYLESLMAMEIRIGGRQQKVEIQTVIAGIKPDKMRVEFKTPLMDMLTVCDGQTTWVVRPRLKEYAKKAAVALIPSLGGDINANTLDFGLLAASIAKYISSRYEHIAKRVTWAKIVRTEEVEVEGKSIDCYVVEVAYEPSTESSDIERKSLPQTFWIDKARYIVLRDISIAKTDLPAFQIEQRSTLTVAKMNEPLPDNLFVFVPPEGAREVDQLNLLGAGNSDLRGTQAVEFTLKDLNGSVFTLKNMAGKVVLLDFWATWCGPCRAELPLIEKLYREFKDKGLVVLGINSEPPETVRDFIGKNKYTFPTLVDTAGEVARRYLVEAIPTVIVIDKGGTITTHYLGLRSEDDLRNALKKAGLE
jgi:peroxiredoxin/outer membrane lipoprotein-sorting protein